MKRLRVAAILCTCLAAAAPAAWAASSAPVRGVQYEGTTAREGTTIVAGRKVRRKSTILLRVARSGKTVTVSVPVLPSSCSQTRQGALPKTRPARISSRGAFSGTITYEGVFSAGIDAKAQFSGRFNGRRVTGTVRAEFLKVQGCNTSTSFSAAVPSPPHK